MAADRIINIVSLCFGIISVIVGIIGIFCLSEANKLKAKEIQNSTINQANTMIVNNGVDTYAIIKIAQDVTQEELRAITETLSATTLDLEKLKREIADIPKIHHGPEPLPTHLKDGDIYLQY